MSPSSPISATLAADADTASVAPFSAWMPGAPAAPVLATLDPRPRLVACVGFALVVVSLARISTLLMALAVAVMMAAMARQELIPTVRRMATLDGFMLFVLLLLPFTMPGEAVLSIGDAVASREGLLRAAEILLKANAVTLMVMALLGSMELVELGHAMARLRLPAKFVQLFLFTVRYITVLGREYRRLRAAMKARGFRMRCDAHTWRSIGYLFGMLLVRSLERSERILAAMRCRGFQGCFHPLTPVGTLGWRDYAFLGGAMMVGGVLLLLEHG